MFFYCSTHWRTALLTQSELPSPSTPFRGSSSPWASQSSWSIFLCVIRASHDLATKPYAEDGLTPSSTYWLSFILSSWFVVSLVTAWEMSILGRRWSVSLEERNPSSLWTLHALNDMDLAHVITVAIVKLRKTVATDLMGVQTFHQMVLELDCFWVEVDCRLVA